jgi:hypothetical protein
MTTEADPLLSVSLRRYADEHTPIFERLFWEVKVNMGRHSRDPEPPYAPPPLPQRRRPSPIWDEDLDPSDYVEVLDAEPEQPSLEGRVDRVAARARRLWRRVIRAVLGSS